ncbi:MAG: glycosyltransferase [Proteobacteria bacterium]|nr:glycosyltransferase [Pseudomonadota bacterium]
MRVLFVSDVYFPRVNGVSTSIATFRADLATAGVETVLVAPQYAGAAASVDDERVIRVPSSPVPRDPEDRRMRWGELRRTLQELRARDFDLVHVHTPFLAHYAGVRFARAARLPVVETYHTFFEEYLHHYVPLLPRALGRRLARAVTRSQCSQVDAVIAPSQPMLDMLRSSGIERPIQVIPTGMPADRYVRGDGARFRREHNLPPDRPLLLYVGRVAHEKNIGFLVESFLAVRRSRPDALLVIAGEGPARASLAAQVARFGLTREVVFVGYLDRERSLADCYAAANVFVFASRTETQGLVLLEAMAQACPIVSTAHLGTASILQPGCGARVAPDEPAAFAQAVLGLLDDPERAARCGAQGQEYARGWASTLMARRMHEFYADVCARAKIASRPASAAGPRESNNERQALLDSR